MSRVTTILNILTNNKCRLMTIKFNTYTIFNIFYEMAK